MINREDMLELTRRMTPSRSHLVRLAGAYLDEEGYIDGTFHTNFLKLKGEERNRCLEIAKEIPFSETNRELVDYRIPGMTPGSIWQLLYALRECELKNDALLLNLYELIAEKYPTGYPYAIYVYYGVYDVPVKGADKERLDESEEVYRYLILAIAPTDEEQIPGMPEAGFLYPAFSNRSTDLAHVNVFSGNPAGGKALCQVLKIE
jgi:hypothetical protein